MVAQVAVEELLLVVQEGAEMVDQLLQEAQVE
jgi:hypothetical protein